MSRQLLSKEEILYKEMGLIPFATYSDELKSATLKAMDEHSKQKAIGFAEWKEEKFISGQLLRLKDKNQKWFYNHAPEEKEGQQQWIAYSTDGLYTLYQQSKQSKP